MTDSLVASPPTPAGYRVIAGLAAPIAMSAVFALGAQWLILVIIGRFGTGALYVRSMYLPVSFLFAALQAGIDVSTQVAVSRLGGATDRLPPVVRGMATAGGTVMLAAGVLIAAGSGPLGGALGVAPASGGDWNAFIRLMCLAIVAEIPWMILAGTLRGWGRTGAASSVSVTVMVVQVVVVAVLGGPLGLGVMAVPWSILVASAVGLGLAVSLTRRAGLLGALRRSDPPAVRPAWRVLATVGLPVGGTFLVLFAANGALIRILNRFGYAVVSGFGIANATQTMLIVPAIGLGAAMSILVNRPGGEPVAGIVRRGTTLTAGVYGILGALAWLLAGPVAHLASADPRVTATTVDYLHVVGPSLACVGVMLTMLTLLEQTGSGFVALAFNIGYFGASIAAGGWLAYRRDSPHALFTALAVANVVALVAIAPIVTRRIARLTRAQE